ncbi:MAG: hypothetical protein VKJ64_21645 [Leptolyngbyaceae bacterium]|nr:hypothetical protein [Leptolyngbyaceae bacterium]
MQTLHPEESGVIIAHSSYRTGNQWFWQEWWGAIAPHLCLDGKERSPPTIPAKTIGSMTDNWSAL